MIKIEKGDIIFSSGRKIEPNNGIIGLSPELEIGTGYDEMLTWPEPYQGYYDADDNPLTAEDMAELADHMIAEWTRFRASLGTA